MQLARFLNKVFKKDGFILSDANSKDYIIGNPKNNPIKLKKNGEPYAKQSEIINGQDYEGVLVKFISQNNDIWEDKNTEGVYFITFNDKIVKIGMTTTSFCERFSSYICGARRAMRKGSCSTTNFLICETLYTGLQLGFNVDIYGIPIQKERRNIKENHL